jgi:hypothetical protein
MEEQTTTYMFLRGREGEGASVVVFAKRGSWRTDGLERRERGVVVGECKGGRGVFIDECGRVGGGNGGEKLFLASTNETGCAVWPFLGAGDKVNGEREGRGCWRVQRRKEVWLLMNAWERASVFLYRVIGAEE